jgi:hypothetical protein
MTTVQCPAVPSEKYLARDRISSVNTDTGRTEMWVIERAKPGVLPVGIAG